MNKLIFFLVITLAFALSGCVVGNSKPEGMMASEPMPEPEPEDMDTEDMDTEDMDTEDMDTEDMDTEDMDTEDMDTEDMDTEDMDTEDMDTEDMDTEDMDTEDMDTEDMDTEDMDTEDMDTEDMDTEDMDTEDMDTEDMDTEDMDTEQEPIARFPDIDWAVDIDQTQTAIGGTALDLTEDEVREAITGIANNPDTNSYLTSTAALLRTGDSDVFTDSDCEGLTCNVGGFQTVGIPDHNFEDNEYQAVMIYGGISFAQSRRLGEELPFIGVSATTEVINYGGWLEHHFFGVQATFDGNTEAPDQVALFSYTFGNASGSNPDDSGSGTWNGVAIGVNAAERFENRSLLTADVTISIADFLDPTVDVMFDSIRDLRTGDPLSVSGFTVPSIGWEDLDLTDGSFGRLEHGDKDPDDFSNPLELRNRIEGRFYGPGHEEVGGIFEYATVAGSFGAERDE